MLNRLQESLTNLRVRTGCHEYALAVEQGKIRLTRVRYLDDGTSHVTAVTNWIPLAEAEEVLNNFQPDRKYTLKEGGKYWTGVGSRKGFLALSVAASYTYTLANVQTLQRLVGGKIVEVIHAGGWHYEEREV